MQLLYEMGAVPPSVESHRPQYISVNNRSVLLPPRPQYISTFAASCQRNYARPAGAPAHDRGGAQAALQPELLRATGAGIGEVFEISDDDEEVCKVRTSTVRKADVQTRQEICFIDSDGEDDTDAAAE
jgi:hypothetical protein